MVYNISMDEYQTEAIKTAVYPTESEIIYPALGLCGEAGEVAEHIKKMIRDNEGKLSEERRDKLLYELGDVLWYIALLARDLDLTLSDVAQFNLAKLASRQERNQLNGDGDNR